jgi:hypothetical protein
VQYVSAVNMPSDLVWNYLCALKVDIHLFSISTCRLRLCKGSDANAEKVQVLMVVTEWSLLVFPNICV